MRTGFVAGGLLLVALAAHAAEDDWQLLRRVAVASHQQPLIGTYLHQTQGTMETFQLVRGNTSKGLIELYQALDGPPREVVRHGNNVTLYAADKTALTMAKFSAMRLFPAVFPEDVGNIQQSYQLKRLEADRVAQSECVWLQLKPKDRARYSFRMCVNPDSALPLKTVTITPQGEVVEQNTFTELELGQPRDRVLLIPRLAGKLSYQIHRTPPNAAPAPGLPDISKVVSGLPNGFRLIKVAKRKLPGQTETTVRQYMFSDGLAMLSLFVEPSDGSKHAERAVALHGPVSLASRNDGDRFLTLVGDLPEQGMASLLKSVHLNKP